MKLPNKKTVIIIGLNLAGLAGLFFLGRQINQDVNQVVAAYQEFYTSTHGQEDFLALTKTLTETTDARATVDTAFLSSTDLISFIERLEGLARTAGVTFKLDEPKVTAGKTASLALSFQVTGSFAGLYHFLSLLENLSYRLDWQSVAWTFNSSTTWSGNFNLAITSYTNTNEK
jgi:Tfp pilus assembly protein PilO